jgi:hypothetical protein
MAGTTRSATDHAALSLVLIGLMGVLYAAISRFALDAFPYSGDEYSTWLQGVLFSHGELRAPAPAHAEWLRIDHVVIDAWVRSKYPPGTSALLALGIRHGVGWLVTPLEAVAALLAVWWATRRVLGPRAALVAVLTLGLAPLFVFNAASFYAHTPTTALLAGAFACVAAWTGDRRDRWLVPAGLAIGAAFLVRPIDAMVFGGAMLALRSLRAVIIAGACALPGIVLNLAYQAAQFGSPFTDGYQVYEPTIEALYGERLHALSLGYLVNPVELWNHLDIVRALAVDWTVPASVVVAIVGARAITREHPARALRTFGVTLVAAYLALLLVTTAGPDDGARPRYLSVALIPIAFLTAAGFASACTALEGWIGRRARVLAVVVVIVFALAQFGAFLQDHIPKVWKREGVFQAAEALHVPDAVVIVRARYPSRYARNGPYFDDVLYLSVPAETATAQVRAAFPGRPIWEAWEGEPWRLVRVP